MQFLDLAVEGSEIAVVVDDIVGSLKAFGPADLGSEDRADFRIAASIARPHAFQLQPLFNVHDQNTVHKIVLSGLDQQWDDQDAVGRDGGFRLPDHFRANERVQYGLESMSFARLVEHAFREPPAVDTAVAGHVRPEGSEDRRHCHPARSRQTVSDFVGIDDRYVQRGEACRHRGFAAADAARESDTQRGTTNIRHGTYRRAICR